VDQADGARREAARTLAELYAIAAGDTVATPSGPFATDVP
jgi:hypothetical protein